MNARSPESETEARGLRMLRSALGPQVCALLDDPQVTEVLLNPDGRVWTERPGEGLAFAGLRLRREEGERIVRLVAHHAGEEIRPEAPRVSAELPGGGERFEGLLPPVTTAPAFAIRKPARRLFTLADYVAAGAMDDLQAKALRNAVAARRNILVAGPTASGKTTLVNALLSELAESGERIVLIEDVRELQCAAPNLVALRTRDGGLGLAELVRAALRLRPDRILVGEVRGREALDLLKAWGTGHPGGLGTIHASSAQGALLRLEQLVQEAVAAIPRRLIAETVEMVAVLSGRGRRRRLVELVSVLGLCGEDAYRLEPVAEAGRGGAGSAAAPPGDPGEAPGDPG